MFLYSGKLTFGTEGYQNGFIIDLGRCFGHSEVPLAVEINPLVSFHLRTGIDLPGITLQLFTPDGGKIMQHGCFPLFVKDFPHMERICGKG